MAATRTSRSKQANPVARAGYSPRPLIRKLGIKEGDRAVFCNEPDDFRESLGPLPEGARATTQLRGVKDYVHLFAENAKRLEGKLAAAVRVLDPDGMLWISWPKKSSGVATDLDGAMVRRLGQEAGLVDVKVCAVDEIWSGHKFMFRREDRERIAASRRRSPKDA